jgi:hypothetical protein
MIFLEEGEKYMSWGFDPGTQATSIPQLEDGPNLEVKKKDKMEEFFWRNTKIGMVVITILILGLLIASAFLV